MQLTLKEQAYLASWQRILAQRTSSAVDRLGQVPGVIGLLLAGSLARGEVWPLSDIDILPIYEDGQAEQAAREVEARRLELLDSWMAEGHRTTLDVGVLAFGRAEVMQALALSSHEATHNLGDLRWFHSLDKGYRSRAAFDPEGLAAALAQWLTDARFTPQVVRGRLESHWRQTRDRYAQAATALNAGDTLTAAISLLESLHALMRYLIEGWGGRDTSFSRFGTRLEHTAVAQGEEALMGEIMALCALSPDDVIRRMELAPQHVRDRHRLSLQARRLVGDVVTEGEDARDALLVNSTREIRTRRVSYAAWVGLETDPTVLSKQLEAYSGVLERARGAVHFITQNVCVGPA